MPTPHDELVARLEAELWAFERQHAHSLTERDANLRRCEEMRSAISAIRSSELQKRKPWP
jgi:hypothetical protein